MSEGGWAKPPRARAAHYWDTRRYATYSICGKWPRAGKLHTRAEIGAKTPLCQLCEYRAPRETP